MEPKKRKILKLLGLTALVGAVGAAIPVVFTGKMGVLAINPKGKQSKLIIDPEAENFMYVDGFIVEVSKAK